MNILIKLTCLVGLVIAPILGGHTGETAVKNEIKVQTIAKTDIQKTFDVSIMANEDGTATATTIITYPGKDGKMETKEETYEGTVEEIEKKMKALEKYDGVEVKIKKEIIKKEK